MVDPSVVVKRVKASCCLLNDHWTSGVGFEIILVEPHFLGVESVSFTGCMFFNVSLLQ